MRTTTKPKEILTNVHIPSDLNEQIEEFLFQAKKKKKARSCTKKALITAALIEFFKSEALMRGFIDGNYD